MLKVLSFHLSNKMIRSIGMLKNKLSCPHCKKDIASVGFRYSSKQWLFVLPILVLGFYPLLSITLFKSSASDDLEISSYAIRMDDDEMVVTGIISNLTDSSWTSVSVEGEFFDESGKFLGEGRSYIGSDIHSNASENFEVRFRNLPDIVLSGTAKTKLKIASGVNSSLF